MADTVEGEGVVAKTGREDVVLLPARVATPVAKAEMQLVDGRWRPGR